MKRRVFQALDRVYSTDAFRHAVITGTFIFALQTTLVILAPTQTWVVLLALTLHASVVWLFVKWERLEDGFRGLLEEKNYDGPLEW